MCGIMGFQIVRPERRIPPMMGVLISYMEERGTHAWGCWTGTKGVQKGLGAFSKFGPPARAFRGTTSMFGHCRFATVGDNTVRNAHPFTSGKITGIHNGSIANYPELNKEYDRDFEVDSEHIFAHIDEGRDFDDLRGYGTVTYIDKEKPERTYLFHWNGGQLSAAKLILDSGELLGSVWASTELGLEKAINSAGFRKYQMWSIPQDQLHWFENGTLFFDEAKLGFGFRATLGNTTHHRHGDGKKVTGGKVVSGKTELQHSTDTENSSIQMGPSSSLIRTTLIPLPVLKAGAPDGQCSDCQKEGFNIQFNDTGIRLCPICWMKWKREEEDRAEKLERDHLVALHAKLEKNKVIIADNEYPDNIVVWTDIKGDVHAEEIR